MLKYFKICMVLFALCLLVFSPLTVVHASGCPNPEDYQPGGACYAGSGGGATCTLAPNAKFGDLLDYGTCIISKSMIPLVFAVALVMFVWGVVQFFMVGAGEEAKREQGKQFIIWGIVALAVMVSVWGLVKVVGNTFNIDYAIPHVKNTP